MSAISSVTPPSRGSEATAYAYNSENNHLVGISGSRAASYSYDANGNTIADGTATYGYDGQSRLIEVKRNGAVVASYGYDSRNRRVRKTVGETTTYYTYDIHDRLIAESLADGTIAREYIYLDGQPFVLREYMNQPGTYFFINDQLGTPQRLVDSSGTVVWQAAYSPFGKAEIVNDTVTNNLRFPGQFYDAESGLYYNFHRYYDPETGRYITADPIGLRGGINLYSYVQNNPVNWIDPEGRSWITYGIGTIGIGVISADDATGIGISDDWLIPIIAGWMLSNAASDRDLQKEIEQEANRREYKNICNEPPPPGLSGCELAKWKLNRAKRCKAAREENTRRWWGGEDNRHDPQLHADNDRAIEKAQALVDRLCRCKNE